MSSFAPSYPYGEFGRAKLPEQADKLLVRGATIWTSGAQGNLENADLYIEKGKIKQVGQNITAPADATIINANGKHVTAGLIDCHSHSAAAGSVNETGQAITAEVRIGDIIDSDDIGIYRELAGGLTAANVLHGSANPIGGQNQVIKLRWGALPEEMKFEGAIPGIKFALGENVKQSNWGERYTTRYPQTRQGVEQIIRDEFQAARDYKKSWDDFKSGARKIPPRRDLQTETLLEILEGKRLVHSHSYRQDEILMLVRIADDFGFKIGTFHHVLEGYKVAEALAKHGAGASMFSDWWAYKMEVIDAIPYCGALMHDAGVVVSFNSDSDEQARRMNTEAAKAVKYGGVSPQDALKFVTLNPAKQLRIDNRVGSLEAGKDADFVIWSGDPLSTYSICEQTWIDGRKYFDRNEDKAMREENQKQRATIVQKVLSAKSDGGGSGGPSGPPRWYKERYSCQDEIEGKESK
jgi:N-acetylglucosamine-6-phosphate deacetylase